MATPEEPTLGNLVNDILIPGLKIPDTAVDNLQDLRGLILQLPSALKAEREAVAEQLSKVASERDRTQAELDRTQAERNRTQAELDRANDENRRLRRETRHLEGQVKLAKEKMTAAANARVTIDSGERSKEGRGTGTSRRVSEDITRATREGHRADRAAGHRGSREGLKDSKDTDPPRRVSESVNRERDRERGDRAVDPRRSRFDERPRAPSDAPRGPTVPIPRAADSYRPSPPAATKRPAPDDENPQPSKHIKHPTSHESRASDNLNALLKARTPVCGACKKHAREDSCDGKAECGTCRRLSHVVCSYRYCELDRECVEATCTYLHSHQWDEKKENWERIVRDRRDVFLSRKTTR